MFRVVGMAVVGLLLVIAKSEARPRDDVMANVFRCNALESDQQWLDCYYGAAQPARAQLGLKSALPGQIALLQALPQATNHSPSAMRSEVIAQAGRCYDQGDDHAWLNCYYQAAFTMRQRLGLAPLTATSKPSNAVNSFGTAEPRSPAALDAITSRMTGYTFDSQKIFTVMLANGQTWRQIDGDSRNASWGRSAGKYIVTIKHGMSGSFILTVQNEERAYRVHRIG